MFLQVSEDLNAQFRSSTARHDAINIKVNKYKVPKIDISQPKAVFPSQILNAGAWTQGSERVSVSLPLELEDYIPEVEEFYKKTHSGRKLQWYHHMSNGTITFSNNVGRFDLDVTTFQMAVLFAWNQRPAEKVSYENLRLATELPGWFDSCMNNIRQPPLFDPKNKLSYPYFLKYSRNNTILAYF